MFPIIESFIKIFKYTGIILELHGQNTLLRCKIEKNGKRIPIGIVARDLSCYIDINVRKKLGMNIDEFPKDRIIDKETYDKPKGSQHSNYFDSSIGHHFFDFLSDIMEKYYSINKLELQKECKNYFSLFIDDYDIYFPDKIYYYDTKPLKNDPYHFGLISKGENPCLRP
jgi:hypothetical protein